MPITLLDGILVAFTLVSAMLAMVRGLSRELLSIASWAAAAAAAYFFWKPMLPYVQPYIDSEQLAMIASAGIVFLIALIVVTIITMMITDFIIDSRVGTLDRTLGFIYGAARGILVVAVGLLFFTWLAGSNLPAWIANAKSRPLLQSVGEKIESYMPENPEELIPRLPGEEPQADGAAQETPPDAPVEAPAGQTPATNN